jgi:hypothetical protein
MTRSLSSIISERIIDRFGHLDRETLSPRELTLLLRAEDRIEEVEDHELLEQQLIIEEPNLDLIIENEDHLPGYMRNLSSRYFETATDGKQEGR